LFLSHPLTEAHPLICRIGHSVVAPGLRKFYFAWLPAEARLQRAQNALARAVVQPQSRALPLSSSSHLLKQLHWLPIDWRIRFKLSTLTFKALHTGRPKYLTDLLHFHKPTRSMRSPYTQLLALPRHNLSFGSRAFRISAPKKNWNTLPLEVLQSHYLSTFRNRLKTFCFRSELSVGHIFVTRPDPTQ